MPQRCPRALAFAALGSAALAIARPVVDGPASSADQRTRFQRRSPDDPIAPTPDLAAHAAERGGSSLRRHSMPVDMLGHSSLAP
jgi:hypothetical protein